MITSNPVHMHPAVPGSPVHQPVEVTLTPVAPVACSAVVKPSLSTRLVETIDCRLVRSASAPAVTVTSYLRQHITVLASVSSINKLNPPLVW